MTKDIEANLEKIKNTQESCATLFKEHLEKRPLFAIVAATNLDGQVQISISKNAPLAELFLMKNLIERALGKILDNEFIDQAKL